MALSSEIKESKCNDHFRQSFVSAMVAASIFLHPSASIAAAPAELIPQVIVPFAPNSINTFFIKSQGCEAYLNVQAVFISLRVESSC
jgi:hypothetical protein